MGCPNPAQTTLRAMEVLGQGRQLQLRRWSPVSRQAGRVDAPAGRVGQPGACVSVFLDHGGH